MRFKKFYLQEGVVIKDKNFVNEIRKRYLKDFKTIEKVFSTVKSPDDIRNMTSSEQKKFNEYFKNLNDKYNKWIYDVLLSKHMKDVDFKSTNKLNFYGEQLRTSAWKFSGDVWGLATDLKSPPNNKDWRNYEDYKRRLLAKIKRNGRDMIKDAKAYVDQLKEEEKKIEFAEPTRFKNVLFQPEGGKEEKDTEQNITSFKKAYNLIKRKGLGLVFKDPLKVELTARSGKDRSAEYDFRADLIRVFGGWGETKTIIHELAHRYWFKYMKPDERQLWINAYNGNLFTITSKDIDDFVDYLKKTYKEGHDENYKSDQSIEDHVKRVIGDYVQLKRNDPNIQHKADYFLDEMKYAWGPVTDPENERKLREFSKDWIGDKQLLKRKITRYGNTNDVEGFAELFALYVMGKKVPKNMEHYFLRSIGRK